MASRTRQVSKLIDMQAYPLAAVVNTTAREEEAVRT